MVAEGPRKAGTRHWAIAAEPRRRGTGRKSPRSGSCSFGPWARSPPDQDLAVRWFGVPPQPGPRSNGLATLPGMHARHWRLPSPGFEPGSPGIWRRALPTGSRRRFPGGVQCGRGAGGLRRRAFDGQKRLSWRGSVIGRAVRRMLDWSWFGLRSDQSNETRRSAVVLCRMPGVVIIGDVVPGSNPGRPFSGRRCYRLTYDGVL